MTCPAPSGGPIPSRRPNGWPVSAPEEASTLVVYDDHGAYGHPDHVQVHRVGIRAAELARTPVVYEATFDRDRMVAQLRALQAEGLDGLPDEPPDESLGVSSELITTRIDVSAQADVKRRAMGAPSVPDR